MAVWISLFVELTHHFFLIGALVNFGNVVMRRESVSSEATQLSVSVSRGEEQPIAKSPWHVVETA